MDRRKSQTPSPEGIFALRHAQHVKVDRWIEAKAVARSKDSVYSDGYTARDNLTQEEAFEVLDNGRCLPLGTTVQSVHGERTMTRSKFHQVKHPAPEVDACIRDHELWVDGDVLWDTYRDPSDLCIYKTVAARSISAIPRRASTLVDDVMTPVWEYPIEWELPCADAPDGVHRFTTVWEPVAIASGRPSSGAQKAMHDLRPLGAEDDRFWDAYGVRNNAESLNSLYKKMFANSEHAMRQRGHEQHVDQIAAAFAMNAVTWLTHKRQSANAQAIASGLASVIR